MTVLRNPGSRRYERKVFSNPLRSLFSAQLGADFYLNGVLGPAERLIAESLDVDLSGDQFADFCSARLEITESRNVGD